MFADAPILSNNLPERYYAKEITDGWVEFSVSNIGTLKNQKKDKYNDNYLRMSYEYGFKVCLVPYDNDGPIRNVQVRGWIKVNGYIKHEDLDLRYNLGLNENPVAVCTDFRFRSILEDVHYYEGSKNLNK